MNNLSVQGNTDTEWFLDSGATSHMASNPVILSHTSPSAYFSHITFGKGSSLPITLSGSSSFLAAPTLFSLNNILISPHMIKNLISIRKFTSDNIYSIEFDPFGIFVKDL